MVDSPVDPSGLAEQSRIVRLPLNQVGSLNKINKAFARFEQEHERTPSPEELATELELPKEKVTDTLRVAGRHVSVDAPFADGEDNSLLDVLVNPDSPNADRGLINESLSTRSTVRSRPLRNVNATSSSISSVSGRRR